MRPVSHLFLSGQRKAGKAGGTIPDHSASGAVRNGREEFSFYYGGYHDIRGKKTYKTDLLDDHNQ